MPTKSSGFARLTNFTMVEGGSNYQFPALRPAIDRVGNPRELAVNAVTGHTGNDD
jgi:hypothetical protein